MMFPIGPPSVGPPSAPPRPAVCLNVSLSFVSSKLSGLQVNGQGADHGSGKGPVCMMPGHALLNIASKASMMFTDMLLPIIP